VATGQSSPSPSGLPTVSVLILDELIKIHTFSRNLAKEIIENLICCK